MTRTQFQSQSPQSPQSQPSTPDDPDASASPPVDSQSDRRSRIRSVGVVVGLLVLCTGLGTAVAIGTVGAIGLGSSADTGAALADSAAETAADPAIVVSDASLEAAAGADATETHRVALTDAPEGLAGFELTLELASTDVATVADAGYPDHFGMTTEPRVGADERTITVEAVDLDDEITDGATDVTLARIDVVGVGAGETELRVADLQVDADGGDAVEPSLEAGTITVTGPGTDAERGSGPDAGGSNALSQDGGEPDDAPNGNTEDESADGFVESIPGFTSGLAIAAIAALAAALVARRD